MAYDYTKLYTLFARMIKAKMGLTMIELNGNGKQPSAPFVAFDIVSPRIPITWLEDEDAFECVVSFTVYAKSKVQAMTLCDQLRDMLARPVQETSTTLPVWYWWSVPPVRSGTSKKQKHMLTWSALMPA